MKKVSVIVPVYGVERFIARCARTLFEQTYPDMEYVFVDDCSPDNSVNILRGVLADYPQRVSQVKIISHESNRGSGAARLTAMQNTTGELVMFVDSDDYIDANCVEKLVARQTETDADVVDGAYCTFTDDRILSTTHPWKGAVNGYLKAILIHNTITHQLWARIIRRSLFEKTGVSFVEGVDHGEDYSVMGRLLMKATHATVDDVVYYYRYNDYGTFADGISSRHITSFLRANGLVCQYIHEHDTDRTFQTAMQIGMLHTCYCALSVGVSLSDVYGYCGRPSSPFFKACMCFARPSLRVALRWLYLLIKKVYKVTVLHVA